MPSGNYGCEGRVGTTGTHLEGRARVLWSILQSTGQPAQIIQSKVYQKLVHMVQVPFNPIFKFQHGSIQTAELLKVSRAPF